MSFLYSKSSMLAHDKERLGTLLVISILVISYVLFFIFQITSEFATLNSVFASNRENQIEVTKATAGLENAKFREIEIILGDRETTNEFSQALETQRAGPLTADALSLTYDNLQLLVDGSVSEVTLIDSEGRVIASQGSLAHLVPGESVAGDSWAVKVKEFREPIFSGSYMPKDGMPDSVQMVSFANPLLDKNGSYLGAVVVSLPSTYLQPQYSEAGSYEYVAILDKNLEFRSSSNKDLVGTSLEEDVGKLQDGTDPSQTLSRLFLHSNSSSEGVVDSVYRNEEGEFLVTGQAISFFDKPDYLLAIKSDTASFYSKVEAALYQNRIQMFSVLAATAVLTVVIASFITRNINLDKQVKEKTRELVESNKTVTDQKVQLEKANDELRKLDELKTEFLSIASHELKTPIQPILLYAEMAKYGDVEKDVAIDVILRQATILKQLSHDILEVSRIESKNLKLNLKKVKIEDLLKASISSQGPKFGLDVQVVLDMDDETTTANIDASRISQVINNLLDNAAKFTKEGQVTIRVRTVAQQEAGQKKMLEIIISDNGPGIPEDMLPMLFTKFSTKDIGGLNSHGTGLGLFICKGIVETHGGKIWAMNNKDGKGATFTFTLPLA